MEVTTAAEANGTGEGGEIRVEGQEVQPWYVEHLSEEYHENPAVTRYTSPDEFVKGALEREKLIGERQGVPFPSAEATPEDWQAFWRQVPGYPETPAGYEIAPPALPGDSPYSLSETDFSDFLQAMHQSGASPQHVNAFVRWFEGNEAKRWNEAVSEAQDMVTKGEQMLTQKWGAKAEFNIRVAEEGLLREFGNLEFLDQLVTKDGESNPRFLRNAPEFIQMAYEWAVSKGHDKYVAGAPGGPASKDAAMQQMSEARTAYRDGKMTVDAFDALSERLAPIIYADEPDIVLGGAFTALDIADERS